MSTRRCCWQDAMLGTLGSQLVSILKNEIKLEAEEFRKLYLFARCLL